MNLSDVKIRSCTVKETAYKLFDGKGLYLLVKPNGSKHWRHKYLFNGKEKSISYGPYPEVTPKMREMRR